MSANLSNSSEEVISLMVDIVEFVASPNITKSVETEGEFFFNIVSNMLDTDIGSNTVENQTASSAARFVLFTRFYQPLLSVPYKPPNHKIFIFQAIIHHVDD